MHRRYSEPDGGDIVKRLIEDALQATPARTTRRIRLRANTRAQRRHRRTESVPPVSFIAGYD